LIDNVRQHVTLVRHRNDLFSPPTLLFKEFFAEDQTVILELTYYLLLIRPIFLENTWLRISNAPNKPSASWSVLLVAEARTQWAFFPTVSLPSDGVHVSHQERQLLLVEKIICVQLHLAYVWGAFRNNRKETQPA